MNLKSVIIVILLTCWSCNNKKTTMATNEVISIKKNDNELQQKKADSILKATTFALEKRTLTKATDALTYCKDNNFNTQYCVLVDMSIHSGKNRLFIWDFKKQEIIKKGLCSHGCCNEPWGADKSKEKPTFSNVHESHCSSLGKYKIGKRGYSNWGINVNYKLHGLNTSNSNAYDRFIVLHSWEEVSDSEVHPNGTAEGWGCPAVSNNFMKYLDKKLQQNQQPILFWIYK